MASLGFGVEAKRASHRPAAASTEDERRERAGQLYQEHLDRFLLEAALARPPAQPPSADPSTARGAVSSLLAELARLYGVRHWSPAEFERVVLRGALAGWRPGAVVRPVDDGYRVISSTCPMGAVVEVDRDACRLCSSFQEALLRQALPGVGQYVSFHELISEGAGTCDSVVRMRVPVAFASDGRRAKETV